MVVVVVVVVTPVYRSALGHRRRSNSNQKRWEFRFGGVKEVIVDVEDGVKEVIVDVEDGVEEVDEEDAVTKTIESTGILGLNHRVDIMISPTRLGRV